ncbi:MAG TPA: SgcJ/EcaC family oxidoreductase [Myxococcaceae bacterium]|nr:SgcJ/EcaC family oxidoreductase [Myxococcaceae bacterium]
MKKIELTVAFTIALTGAADGREPSGSIEDEKAIRALGPALSSQCWARSDAKACAAFWAEEGSLVTPNGSRIDGQGEIEKLLDKDLKGLFKGSTSQCTVQTIQWLKPDAAFVDIEQVVTGLTRPDGGVAREQTIQLAATVVRRSGRWLIADARSFILLPPPNRSAESAEIPKLRLVSRRIPIPGAEGKPVALDYLAADRDSGRIWIPAGNTGGVMLINAETGAVSNLDGFPTSVHDLLGSPWKLGPSAVAVGKGVVYIGNRGDSKVCVVQADSLKRGACISLGPASGGLASSADGLAYVQATEELWATMGAPPLGILPKRPEIIVMDAKSPQTLRLKTRILIPGNAEGYAIDQRRGIFYSNLEEQGRTIGIKARSHRLVANWRSGCDKEGPRGLAVDEERNFLFVACTDRVITLDAGHGGAQLATATAGTGIDNIDYLPSTKQLFVAAGKSGLLTVFRVDDRGALIQVASEPTTKNARVVVADAKGTAYVADPTGGQIIELRSDSTK